jgi:hypothetical protein
LTFVVLFFAFDYFDPINALDVETDTINMLLFGIYVPIVFSIITIMICVVIGLPLRLIPSVRNWWLSKPLLPLVILALGILLLFLSINPNFQITGIVDENGRMLVRHYSNVYISLTGWFLTAFILLHLYPAVTVEYFAGRLSGKSDWTKRP